MIPFDKYEELELLIFKEIDGVCSDQEFAKLNDYISSDPEAMDYYLELIMLCSGLCRSGELMLSVSDNLDSSSQKLSDIWLALAEDESKAKAIQIEPPQNQEFTTTPKPQAKRTLFPLITAISVAACFFIVISILVISRPQIFKPVATITNNSAAVWQSSRVCSVGSRVYTGTDMELVDGFAEITFDNQAKIIIQSPSKIVIEDNNQLFLQFGKIAAVVPPPAKGFLVRTNGASIVDYGTEFGVIADLTGNTETHVFVGLVELRCGLDPIRFESFVRLEGGQASKVNDGILSDKSQASPMSFVRSIPEIETFGIPGKRLDLADILGGGNGLGTGDKCIAIDPSSGNLDSNIAMEDRLQENNNYSLVPGNPCIDGVFVPNGSAQQKVTSKGHIVNIFPETDGRFWTDISNLPITGMAWGSETQADNVKLASIDGVQYGNQLHPAIVMHPNTGITFDLDVIRSANPGVNVKAFTSTCGLSDTLSETAVWSGAKSVLWVLIDGVVRETVEINSDETGIRYLNIQVTILSSDRFLTLVATDGQNSNVGDWTIFGDPALELEPVK